MSYQCTIHVQSPVGMNGKGNCTEDKYVFKLVIRFVAYVTKLSKSQTFLNKQLHLWHLIWSSPEYKAIRRAMQLWRNRLVFRSSYGQPQFSTMTEGIISGHNQWAGKQAPDHCPITVLIASKNNGCLHRKTLKQYIYRYSFENML